LYALASTAHKSGGGNTEPVVATFQPEDVTGYEVGWKARLLGGRLSTQVDAYYNRFEHYQYSMRFNGIDVGANVEGASMSRGLEAQAQARFGALAFDGGLSYMDTRLGEQMAVDATTCNASQVCAPAQQIGGNQAPNAPRWMAHLGAQYRVPTAQGVLTPRLDVAYMSERYATVFNNPYSALMLAHTLVNAQLAYTTGDWRWVGYVTNLTDAHYINYLGYGNLRFAGAPREFGIRLARSF
ncbi:MAG: TonB-dependent receptor domain-containing protein, partial [Rhodoferax sp.]